MEVEKSTEFPDIKRGRPIIYPFEKLEPNTKITIPGNEDLKNQRLSVVNSLNYYKRVNALQWQTVVVIEAGNIVAYRKD